jgi:membrane-associated phospholipid phosphatase
MKRAAAFAVLAALSGPSIARAGGPAPLRYDLRVDGGIATTGTLVWFFSEWLGKPYLAPRTCKLCGTDESHSVETVNGLDRGVRNHLVWNNTKAAGTLSNALAFGAVPLGAIATTVVSARSAGSFAAAGPDLVLLLEATSLTAVVNQALKFWVGRERPFVHLLDEGLKAGTPEPDDNNLSFYSGHTSFTMSIAVSAGTIAWLRGYRAAPWIWGIGIPLSLFVGYLRIGADKHYFTDVLVGALVGAAFGFFVPYLFHRWEPGNPPDPSITPAGSGIAFQF